MLLKTTSRKKEENMKNLRPKKKEKEKTENLKSYIWKHSEGR